MGKFIAIYGTGIDIVDKSEIIKLMNKSVFEKFKNKWLTYIERNYLEISQNKVDDFATIFSIKEAFIKASCGHAVLKDFPYINININKRENPDLSYKDNEFLKNKSIVITTFINDNYVLSSVTIFY